MRDPETGDTYLLEDISSHLDTKTQGKSTVPELSCNSDTGKEQDSLCIPLLIHGVMSYFPGRKPTAEEYERCEQGFCIELTMRMLNGIRKPRGLQNKRRLC
jgi:hypothetical protein